MVANSSSLSTYISMGYNPDSIWTQVFCVSSISFVDVMSTEIEPPDSILNGPGLCSANSLWILFCYLHGLYFVC